MAPSVITPSIELIVKAPLAGTCTENHTSPPAYKEQVGAVTPALEVAPALV